MGPPRVSGGHRVGDRLDTLQQKVTYLAYHLVALLRILKKEMVRIAQRDDSTPLHLCSEQIGLLIPKVLLIHQSPKTPDVQGGLQSVHTLCLTVGALTHHLGRLSLLSSPGERSNAGLELGEFDGLAEMQLKSCLQGPIAVFQTRIRRECNRRNLAGSPG